MSGTRGDEFATAGRSDCPDGERARHLVDDPGTEEPGIPRKTLADRLLEPDDSR